MRTIKSDSTVVLGLCVSKRSWCRDRKSQPVLRRTGSSWRSTSIRLAAWCSG